MNKVLLTLTVLLFFATFIRAANPHGDLRIEMLEYHNLVVDHNIQTPAGASPRAVYIGVKFCNDGANPLTDVFANIGDFIAGTPGVYPVTTVPSGLYSGSFSFTHEGGTKDAVRYIGTLAPGECVTQYWLLSYPLLDANGNRVVGSKPDQTDDLRLKYDVWASANDGGTHLEANTSKTLQLRAEISAMANKIWPNTTSKVPNEFLAAFPDKQLGWRQTTPSSASHPGATVVLEGIWFDLGNIRKGFDNNGDYIPDYNFLLQPVGNPAIYDANCFRLVKVSGLIVIKLHGGAIQTIEFTDQMHFKGIPDDNTGAVGMVFYEFAVLNGPCSSTLTPYQEVASGSDNEKHNGDFGTPGGTLTSAPPVGVFTINAPPSLPVGQTAEYIISYNNNGAQPIGLPNLQNNLVFQSDIPTNTSYIAGSASANNTLPLGNNASVLYSTDNGHSWFTSEPSPANTVTNIQWWLSQPLGSGQTAEITFEVMVDNNYPDYQLKNTGAVSLGNSTPFLVDEVRTLIQGNYSITGKVFNDNGAGAGGIGGDGIQNGTETGLPNITVLLYLDENKDGRANTDEDVAQTTATNPTGTYFFNNLSDGSYVVKVNSTDADIPSGLSSTSSSEVPVDSLSLGNPSVSFGYGSLLQVVNSVSSTATIYENDIVTLNIGLQNQTFSEDTDNSSSVTAWASVLDPATNFNITPNNMLGAPNNTLANYNGQWEHRAVVKGFNFTPQPGEIEKVELLFQFCTDKPVNDDKLQAKITLENGSTVIVPNPILGKNSSPSLNDYVGDPQLGIMVIDVTNVQEWNWSVFDPEWKVTLEGVKVGGNDGAKIWVDAIGVKVTSTCCTVEGEGEPGECVATIQEVPLAYTYDPARLQYLSSTIAPDEVESGQLKWNDLGPVYPGQSKTVSANFRALQPELSACALSAPECLSVPNPWSQCDILSSGYTHDKVISGNVTWNTILSSVSTTNVTGNIRIKGTGTITVPNGDLIFNACYFVLDGPTLVVANGNVQLNQYACVLLYNGRFMVKGNVAQTGNQSFLCVNNMTVEVGDEAANGYFNTSGSPTSANFSNDGGNRRLENVCLNVTHDFTLSSSSTSQDVIINTCAEIGDQGATHASSGTIDGNDSGNFQVSKNCKIFSSEFVVVENIDAQSGSTFQACDSKFKSLNGNFNNSGTFKGCENMIWVPDNKNITNGGTWSAVISKRRGSSTLGTQYIPANATAQDISVDYGNCSCTDANSATNDLVTTASVTQAKNCEDLTVNPSLDHETLVVLDRGSVSGIVFGDKDNDGWKGVTGFEPGTDYYLQGVEVTLYGCVSSSGGLIYPGSESKRCNASPNNGSWSVIKKDTTDVNGFYRFEGLKNGYYYSTVTTSTVVGMTSQSADPDQTGIKCTTCNSTWKLSTSNLSAVGIIGAANDFYQVNYGYYMDEAIKGKIYNDVDGDGVTETTDVPLPNVTVKLVSGTCTTGCPTTTTNANGEYKFTGLNAGTNYTIQVVTTSLPSTGGTWTQTYECDGTKNNSVVRNITTGSQSNGNDFGFKQNGNTDLGGIVYYDWHGNASVNSGDEGIPGVTIKLCRDNNNNGVFEDKEPVVKETVTGTDGRYNFSALPPGNYIVELNETTLPIFPYQTENPKEAGICSTCDATAIISNVNGVDDRTDIDFGYTVSPASRPNATISGVVFEDADANGLRHFSEIGLPNVSVSLKGDMNGDGNFVVLRTIPSSQDGSYSFNALLDGDYSLIVSENDEYLPLSYKASTVLLRSFRIAGGVLVEVDDTSCGTCEGQSIDFGFSPSGSIESFVFFDANGNGTMDWKEVGIPSAIVYLCQGENVNCTATNALDTVQTNADGLFHFDDLNAGLYSVAVDLSSLPSGLTLTADPSTDGIPCYSPLSPADPNYALLSAGCDSKYGGVHIYLGSQARNVNFGYQPASVIGNLVWRDVDLDGEQDNGEPGMPEIEVRIENITTVTRNGTTYPPGTFVDTSTTDFDGVYSFINIPDGTWEVELIPPVGMVTTYDADGTLDNKTEITVTGSEVTNVGNVWCPIGEDCSLDITFGLRPTYPNTVTGTVCLDTDSDGQCDPLIDVTPNNIIIFVYGDDGTQLGQTYADVDGNFEFNYLPNDTVIISVSMTQTPLQLTSITTSTGDTPAFEVRESAESATQRIRLTGDVSGIDFAFAFTDTFDLGDLPLPYLTSVNGVSTGPAHILEAVPTLYLGAGVDPEFHAITDATATGDDLNGIDDEDGVVFSDPSTWTVGTASSGNGGDMTITVVGNGYLLAWVDFNQDGDFNDRGEMVVSQSVTTGIYPIGFDIPDGTDLTGGQELYTRVRIMPSAPFSPETSHEGIVSGGEVEDYMLTVCHNLTDAGSITGNETGCNGFDPSAITETLAPSGGGGMLEYQWQQSTDDGLTWTDIPGATDAAFDPVAITETTRYRRGALREHCAGMVYSAPVIKTVLTNFDDAGIIVGDEDYCGIYDPGAMLNILAPSGGSGTGTVYYQWQQSTDGGTTWMDIAAANDEYYDPGIISQTTQYRRAARKAPCGDYVYSNVIVKMVAVNFISAGTITGNESFCGSFDPGIITNTSLPSGGTDGYIGYQWERSIDGGNTWVVIPGATGIDYNPGNITQSTQYRRKARRVPCGVWVNSNVVTKDVRSIPTGSITTFPVSGSGTLCELTDYVFSAANAGAGVDYHWDFGPYANMATSVEQGPMNVQFNVPNNTAVTTTTITLTVDKDGCTVTDSKVLNFRPEIVINNVILTDPDACSAMNGSITILATHPPLSTILYSVDGGATWTNSNNVSSLGAGVYDIKVRYVNGDCEERYGYVSLSDPPPAADLFVSSMEECIGQSFTVNAVATAGAPTYTWFFGNNAIPATAAGPGPHDVTFISGGPATIAVRLEEAGCVGLTDTTLFIVENYSDGGSILGGGTLCSEYNPAAIAAGSNPAGGYGGSAFFQWEQREKTDSTGWGAWSEIVGANSASFDPGIISNTTEYRRKARRSPCTDWVYSNSVTTVLMLKPLLGDDNYFTVCPGFPFADNVNINDYSLKNPTFSLLIWPTNGTLDFENDGEILYVPNSTYCGTDEFKYFVCNDGTVCCDTANVIVDLTDIVPPTIANVPANITISCDDQMPLTETVQVIENCQNVSIGIDQFITQGSDSCALYNYDFVRVWNGVDYCTNTNQATQTISVEDKTSPDIYRIYTLPNGKRLVAGVMENVTEHWKTVALPVNFATQPVIFAQITTRNDAAPAVVRLRNVSTTQFQVRVQEEEAADGVRLRENIAWIAMEKGTYGGSIPFEVNTWLLTHVGAVQAFAQSYSIGPAFLASVQTNNEGDPVNLRYDNLSSGNVKVHLQEETSLDAEVDHNYETIGYMAIQGNTSFKTNTGEVFGEVGRVNVTESIVTVNLQHTYHNPVVIVGSPSYNDQSPVTTRVFGVTSNSFQVKLDEYDYLDGTHSVENLSYFVVEGSLPLDRFVSCDNIPAPLAIGTEIIAKDNCDATVLLRMSENDLEFDCATDTVLIRTWYVVDDCGNETQLSHRMMLRDTEAPTFTVPDNVTIVCGDNTADLNITGNVTDAADNCAIEVHPFYIDDQSNMLGCNGFILRTWIAEDDCGNMTTKVQTITVTPPIDTDLDGVANYFDLDDDNDGIPDTIEGDTDSDGDGVPNSQDRDSDNDGIPDLVETGRIDTNGDGVIDIIGTPGWDNDNDGFAYGYDGNDINPGSGASSSFNPGSVINDRDQDGVPNYLDRDSDNDGITDLIEAGGADTDGDGILDYPTIGDPLTMPDVDGDGLHDRLDADDDGMTGAEDTSEPLIKYDGYTYTGGLSSDKPDFDGDSVPNYLDTDSDNDGIPDLIEAGGVDFDGDGRLKLTGYFIDVNTDGYFDIYAVNPLVSTDAATANGSLRPKDSDYNGTAFVTGDADLDGRPNHMDHDSDNDKIVDIYETGMYSRDVNGDGMIDNFTDVSTTGFDDIAEASGNIITEQDGATLDGRPEDSGDADETAYVSTQSDGTFASANGTPDVDDDGDGLLNFLDVDSDNDLILDIIEDKNYNGKINVGETHLYNADTDGDAIKDGFEDRNRNGKRDPDETDALNPNTDGDSLNDGDEDTNKDGVVDAGESRPLDPCDPLLSVACKGVAVNVKLKLLGPLVGVSDTTSVMRDDLRQKLVLPTTEPYTKLTHIDHIGVPANPNGQTGTPGTNTGIGDFKESFTPGLLYVTGLDAPVDWVLVELRSASNPDSVIATRAGILQADGDVRDIDGHDYLRFSEITNGNYFVSIRHRNHLGTMTSVPYLLSPYPTDIDFTNPSFGVYGTYASSVRNGEMALWPGDYNNDGKVLYQGPANDIAYLFQSVLLHPANEQSLANYVIEGYKQADLNLDGFSIYQGPNNDRSMLLLNTILMTPENVLLLANFIVQEKLP